MRHQRSRSLLLIVCVLVNTALATSETVDLSLTTSSCGNLSDRRQGLYAVSVFEGNASCTSTSDASCQRAMDGNVSTSWTPTGPAINITVTPSKIRRLFAGRLRVGANSTCGHVLTSLWLQNGTEALSSHLSRLRQDPFSDDRVLFFDIPSFDTAKVHLSFQDCTWKLEVKEIELIAINKNYNSLTLTECQYSVRDCRKSPFCKINEPSSFTDLTTWCNNPNRAEPPKSYTLTLAKKQGCKQLGLIRIYPRIGCNDLSNFTMMFKLKVHKKEELTVSRSYSGGQKSELLDPILVYLDELPRNLKELKITSLNISLKGQNEEFPVMLDRVNVFGFSADWNSLKVAPTECQTSEKAFCNDDIRSNFSASPTGWLALQLGNAYTLRIIRMQHKGLQDLHLVTSGNGDYCKKLPIHKSVTDVTQADEASWLTFRIGALQQGQGVTALNFTFKYTNSAEIRSLDIFGRIASSTGAPSTTTQTPALVSTTLEASSSTDPTQRTTVPLTTIAPTTAPPNMSSQSTATTVTDGPTTPPSTESTSPPTTATSQPSSTQPSSTTQMPTSGITTEETVRRYSLGLTLVLKYTAAYGDPNSTDYRKLASQIKQVVEQALGQIGAKLKEVIEVIFSPGSVKMQMKMAVTGNSLLTANQLKEGVVKALHDHGFIYQNHTFSLIPLDPQQTNNDPFGENTAVLGGVLGALATIIVFSIIIIAVFVRRHFLARSGREESDVGSGIGRWPTEPSVYPFSRTNLMWHRSDSVTSSNPWHTDITRQPRGPMTSGGAGTSGLDDDLPPAFDSPALMPRSVPNPLHYPKAEPEQYRMGDLTPHRTDRYPDNQNMEPSHRQRPHHQSDSTLHVGKSTAFPTFTGSFIDILDRNRNSRLSLEPTGPEDETLDYVRNMNLPTDSSAINLPKLLPRGFDSLGMPIYTAQRSTESGASSWQRQADNAESGRTGGRPWATARDILSDLSDISSDITEPASEDDALKPYYKVAPMLDDRSLFQRLSRNLKRSPGPDTLHRQTPSYN